MIRPPRKIGIRKEHHLKAAIANLAAVFQQIVRASLAPHAVAVILGYMVMPVPFPSALSATASGPLIQQLFHSHGSERI